MTASARRNRLIENPIEALDHIRPLDRFTERHRSELVAAIQRDLERWNAPSSARRSADRLGALNGWAVVTGQQAGIAAGPLFTLYKGLGVIDAAKEMQTTRGDSPVVPVFWIESDDHDFEEARAVGIIDRNGDYQVLRYDDNDDHRRHVGDRVVSIDGIGRLADELRSHLPESDFTNGAIELLTDSYRDGETLADGFARFLYALLGETELVVVSARNPVLKRLSADVLEAEGVDPLPMYDALKSATEDRKREGHQTPIDPKEGGLFITVDGERRSLDVDGGAYVIRGTDQRLTRAEVASIARETPELLSPNVALRPVIQDAAIPTVLYVAGPTEYAYHGQLSGVYSRFKVEQPAVAPRPSALLLEPKVVRALESGPLTLDELLQHNLDISARLIDAESDHAIDNAKSLALARLEEAWHVFDQIVVAIDGTLEKSTGAGIASGAKDMENLARKLRSALKRREETTIRRMEGARMLVLPGGNPQERALNVIGFIARYGLDAIRHVLSRVHAASNVLELRP